ncbi:MAG: iron-sulfur cluster assembly scaffold protein [Dehalobacterium sp.]
MAEEGWTDFMELIEKLMIEKYGKTVVDHANNPRNKQMIEDVNGYASNTGQCGDTIEIWLQVASDTIEKIAFKSDGCEITQASGSMVTELAKGKSIPDALKINALQLIDALGGLPDDHIHCAYLATNALHEAIKNYKKNLK